MDKTRVDDMLIEMITPKVQEIETKFTSGQGLTQEDINTLLLKSQNRSGKKQVFNKFTYN